MLSFDICISVSPPFKGVLSGLQHLLGPPLLFAEATPRRSRVTLESHPKEYRSSPFRLLYRKHAWTKQRWYPLADIPNWFNKRGQKGPSCKTCRFLRCRVRIRHLVTFSGNIHLDKNVNRFFFSWQQIPPTHRILRAWQAAMPCLGPASHPARF